MNYLSPIKYNDLCKTDTPEVCLTAGCLGGWAVIQAGCKLIETNVASKAREILCLDMSTGSFLFYGTSHGPSHEICSREEAMARLDYLIENDAIRPASYLEWYDNWQLKVKEDQAIVEDLLSQPVKEKIVENVLVQELVY